MTKQKNTTLAAVAYVLFLIPLFTSERKDLFVKYHVRQAIGLLIVVLAAQGIISIMGYLGIGSRILLIWLLRLFLVVQVVLGVSNALKEEMKPLPWLGKYAEKF